ncbi:MAG: family 43 glycosylhydrolase [Bacteroidetes bacterium]|nr:family 43 glycosylhydrolase [Bacteroidota bacterium]
MEKKLLLLCLVFNTLACSSKEYPQKETDTKYKNPVLSFSLPDPTIIQTEDKSFYLYATEDIRNLPIYKSTDLINWKFVGTAFTDNTRPNFEPDGGIWAPDINRINGTYVMYYSMSVWGGEWTCGIGIATANTPNGSFIDRGMLFRSNSINVQNSIDPFYIEDGGRKYLFWGSFHGIYGIELTEDGLLVKSGAVKKQIAGTAYEGTYIHKKDGYYYLFASTGTCCEGLNSTYQTVVGRSENLWGPYVDKYGQDMLNNHHEILIHKNSAFVGTGHNSEIVSDDAGQNWIFYHGVDRKNPEGRVLLLDKVYWENGWPLIKTDSPSIDSERPVFKNNND